MKKQNLAIIRPDILEKNLSVPVGSTHYGKETPLPYRWTRDDEGFEVFLDGKWQEAYSIDFDFI